MKFWYIDSTDCANKVGGRKNMKILFFIRESSENLFLSCLGKEEDTFAW